MSEYDDIVAAHPEIGLITRLMIDKARLISGITDIIAVCEQDARDQDHNAGTTGFGPGSKAYAEGRGTACRGIAARLRTLLSDPLP